MDTNRRGFLGLLTAGAAGLAAGGVPSLEAAAAEFRQVGETGQLASLQELRRAYLGEVTPFMVAPAPVDVNAVDVTRMSLAKALTEDPERPFVYYVPAVASGGGFLGSLWKTNLQGRNMGDLEASLVVELHPRDVAAQPSDPVSVPQYVAARAALRMDDPLDALFGASGAGWLVLRSSQPLSFSTSYTFNQAADGTQQGQGLPVFDASTSILAHERFAKAGDEVNFELYGAAFGEPVTKRENWLLFVPPESGAVVVDYAVIGADGGEQQYGSLEVESGMFRQLNGIQQSLGIEVRPGSRLRTRIRSRDGDDIAVYQTLSKIDNLDSLKQDPWSDEGTIDRMLESEPVLYRSSGETNDPKVTRINIKPRGDATVEEIHIDWDGDGTYDEHITGINAPEYNLETLGTRESTMAPGRPA